MSITLCTIGVQAGGKTCLCERYVNGTFSHEYLPSFIPASYSRQVTVQVAGREQGVVLTIRDVFGNLAYERLLSAAFRDCEGALVVCAPSGDDDPDILPRWINALFNEVGDVPLVFALNKCDLGEPGGAPGGELERTVQSFRSVYFNTSALTGENVDKAFEHLVADVIVRRELECYKGVIL
jgi:small GTP-binding protein